MVLSEKQSFQTSPLIPKLVEPHGRYFNWKSSSGNRWLKFLRMKVIKGVFVITVAIANAKLSLKKPFLPRPLPRQPDVRL